MAVYFCQMMNVATALISKWEITKCVTKLQEKGGKERIGKRREEEVRVTQWCAGRKQGHGQGCVLRLRHRKQPLLHHHSHSGRHKKSREICVRDQILVLFVEKRSIMFFLFIQLRVNCSSVRATLMTARSSRYFYTLRG